MSFSYRGTGVINHTLCGSSDSTNFPALVFISDATMKDTGHGGQVQNSSGNDILAFSDSGLTTQIASEIGFYDNVNGILWMWVQVGTVSHTADTTIYVGYGNASPPSRTTNPWDANYVGIWHLPNGTTLGLTDSSASGNNGTNHSATAVAGKVDGGAAFVSASTQYIDITGFTANTVFANATFNVSMWFKTSSVTQQLLLSKGANNDANAGFGVFINQVANKISILVKGTSGGVTALNRATSTSANNNAWGHFSANVTTNTSATTGQDIQLFLNGASDQGALTNSLASLFAGSVSLKFGRRDAPTYYDGSLDEIRISNIARDANWILTEYNNQNAPGTFITWSVAPTAAVDALEWGRQIHQPTNHYRPEIVLV